MKKALLYQTVPTQLLIWGVRERKVAVVRDYLYFRQVSKFTCGYFKVREHQKFINSSTIKRLMDEGFITRHSRGHYKITSVKNIYRAMAFDDRKTIRDIHLSEIDVPVGQFSAYILAKIESYIGNRKYRALKYMKRKNWLTEPEDAGSMSFQIARDKILADRGTTVKLSCRYMNAILGGHPSTISRQRRKYNGVFNSYERSYCPAFDKLRLRSKEDVHRHVIHLSQMEKLSGGDPYRHHNIIFDKKWCIYRKVVSTTVLMKNDCRMGVLHKKNFLNEPPKQSKYISLNNIC